MVDENGPANLVGLGVSAFGGELHLHAGRHLEVEVVVTVGVSRVADEGLAVDDTNTLLAVNAPKGERVGSSGRGQDAGQVLIARIE